MPALLRQAQLLALLPALVSGCGDASPGASSPAPNGPVTAAPSSSTTSGPTSDRPPATLPLPLPPSGKRVGATPVAGGVEFRVWAPNATKAFVIGEAAGPASRHELTREDGGYFGGRVEGARAGQHYAFELARPDGTTLVRLDPRGRQIQGAENVVIDPRAYAWKTTAFTPPPRERAVVYELHVGSFHGENGAMGTFATATAKLDALADLGVNAIELMPVDSHGTKNGWGYNPQSYFAPHVPFGTPDELRAFVDAAHQRGIAVVLDIVFNHSDGWNQAPLRCFDGHCPGDGAGIYFFEAEPYRSTPWGPRPDFSKKEVSDFFADDVFAWMQEYRIDGFRHDSVSNIRAIDGHGTVPGGSELLRRLNEVSETTRPGGLFIAEDLKGHAPITQDRASGGLGFHSQWDGGFHWAVTGAVAASTDTARDLRGVRDALLGRYNGEPFERVLYTESHDTAGNDGARLPARIDAANPTSLVARRRTMLAAGVLLTAPGIPMLFMGQEMLETAKFMPDPAPLDWTRADTYAGVRAFHRDLIRMRRNADGISSALTGNNVIVTHLNDAGSNRVLIYRRWNAGGDDMMVIANFGATKYPRYDVGLPSAGPWTARVDGDHVRYGADLGSAQPTGVTNVIAQPRDGLPFTGSIALGPYSIVVLGR